MSARPALLNESADNDSFDSLPPEDDGRRRLIGGSSSNKNNTKTTPPTAVPTSLATVANLMKEDVGGSGSLFSTPATTPAPPHNSATATNADVVIVGNSSTRPAPTTHARHPSTMGVNKNNTFINNTTNSGVVFEPFGEMNLQLKSTSVTPIPSPAVPSGFSSTQAQAVAQRTHSYITDLPPTGSLGGTSLASNNTANPDSQTRFLQMQSNPQNAHAHHQHASNQRSEMVPLIQRQHTAEYDISRHPSPSSARGGDSNGSNSNRVTSNPSSQKTGPKYVPPVISPHNTVDFGASSMPTSSSGTSTINSMASMGGSPSTSSMLFNNGIASTLHAFGNSRPSCSGRFLCAKDFTSSAVVFVLVVTFTSLFVYSWLQYGIRRSEAEDISHRGTATNSYNDCNGNFRHQQIPATVQLVLATIAIVTMFATVATNPGVLLKQVGKNARNHKPPQGHVDYIELNGIQVFMPYCSTCNIIRPPRSGHCVKCNNCVDRYDHHCGMIGACVGKRNFRLFLVFLYAMITMAIWSLVWSITLAWIIFPTTDTVNKVFCISTAVASGLTLCMLSYMGTHYCKLIRRGYTQREYIKREKLYPAGRNPYDDGCFKNWMDVCGVSH